MILSAGIHGNETKGLEVIDRLLQLILKGKAKPNQPILMIMGNPPAILQQTRELAKNLNRMFKPHSSFECYEQKRALLLMDIVKRFNNVFSGADIVHWDLHSTIRENLIDKFILTQSLFNDWPLLKMGVGAVLKQTSSAATFSAFSASLGIKSATLELGQSKPFGQNDVANEVSVISQFLVDEIKDYKSPPIYKVVGEIIKKSKSFEFNSQANLLNFATNVDCWLYQQNNQKISSSNAILFANQDIAIGERAGLLAQKIGR